VPGHEAIDGNEMADQLAKVRPEPACGISVGVAKRAALGSLKWTQTGRWALCQYNTGAVETEQRPARMGGRTTHWD
jgi:hypothetical protein